MLQPAMKVTPEKGKGGLTASSAGFPPEFFYEFAKKAIAEGNLALAVPHLMRFVAANPEHGKAYRKLGFCYFMMGDFEGATESLRRAVALRPSHLQSVMMLGHALFTVGDPEGEEILRRVLTLKPTNELQRSMLGQTQLLFGEYADGWVNSEARWGADQLGGARPFLPSSETPIWDGRAALGRTLFVYSEGGFGDIIMFSRFLPAVRERVGRLVVQAHPSLHRLFSSIPGVDEVVARRDPGVEYDWFTSTSSLPYHLNVRVEDLPWSDCYLQVPPTGPILEPGERLRVGLVWAGNPRTRHDPDRSIPDPELLRPLIDLPGIDWISLQVGSRASDVDKLGIAPTLPLADWGDTAHVIRQLDLVVTVDTGVAHLAGALGVPVWVMTPSVPEFRWMLRREDSPWYPSMRLFRRKRSGDWAAVVGQVQAAIEEWSGRQRHQPR